MADKDDTSNAPLAGTAMTARQVRILKRVVIAMGVLLVAGFAVVLVAIVYQASRLGKAGRQNSPVEIGAAGPAGARPPASAPGLPEGARLVSSALDGDRALLVFETTDGFVLLDVDLATRRTRATTLLRTGADR